MSNNLNIQSEIFKLLNNEYPEFKRKINISDYVVPTVSSSTIQINRRVNSNLLHFKLNSGISGNIKINIIGENTNNYKIYDIYGEEVNNLSLGYYDTLVCEEYFVILNRDGLSEATLANYNLIEEVLDNIINDNTPFGGKFDGVLNNSVTENKLSPGVRNKLNKEVEIPNGSIDENKLNSSIVNNLSKTSRLLNVNDFGAKPNEDFDNSLAFRTAYNNNLRKFEVPIGTYTFDNPFIININESLNIRGLSRKESILMNDVGMQVYDATLDLRNDYDSSISNLTMDGNIEHVPGDIWVGVGSVKATNSRNLTIRDVTFRDNIHVSVFLRNTKNTIIDNCSFINVDSGINGAGSTSIEDLFITRCYFDGHIESEPVSIPRSKRITITDCVMKNKRKGHVIAFEGSKEVYVNNIYAENCGNAIFLEALSGDRPSDILVENSTFVDMQFGARIKETDRATFRNCHFGDGFYHIMDSHDITFEECTFTSKNNPCMVAFDTAPSSNIKFIRCKIDNTANKNWGNAFVTLYDTQTKVTGLLFEDCEFINCNIINGDFSLDSTVKLTNNTSNGNPLFSNKISITTENYKSYKIANTVLPTSGFHKKNAMIAYANPTTHIGAINMNDGYAYSSNWRNNNMTIWAGLHLKLSNNKVIRVKSGTLITSASSEPLSMNSSHTYDNPFTDANGNKLIYLGDVCNFKNYGAIEQ